MKKKRLIIMVLICSIFLYLNVFAEESLLVDENGNVGIGTLAPNSKLTITTNTDLDGVMLSSDQALIKILPGTMPEDAFNPMTESGDSGIVFSGSSFVLIPWGSNYGGLRIDENGNVGVGLSNPSSKLHVDGKITMSSAAILDSPGRMHISGGETLYLLNTNGVIISKAWGGTGNLSIEGDVYGYGNASFASYTDRTPFYEGDALSEIAKISGKGGEIDHSTLPDFVHFNAEVPVYKEVALQEIPATNAFETVLVNAEKEFKTVDDSGNVVKNKVQKGVQKISKGFKAENGKIVEVIDETPSYESEQSEKIQLKSDVYLDETTGKVYQKTGNGEIYKKDGKIYQKNQTGIENEEQRDIGAMVSMLTVAVQQLDKKNAALLTQNQKLEENNKQLEERLFKLESMLVK